MKQYLSLIKFSHTVFALPFALLGLFLGFFQTGKFVPDWLILIKVLACMVFARSAAMAFNRYVDRDIDKTNPRTAMREIPAGKIRPPQALFFVVLNGLLFIATTYWINRICFYLSPVALIVVLGYSYTKRFTFLCHLILGLGLSLAPIGAYLAVTGVFALVPVLYSLSVLCWVSGFDIIYALQDERFDAEHRLQSIPVQFGAKTSLRIFIGFTFYLCDTDYLCVVFDERIYWPIILVALDRCLDFYWVIDLSTYLGQSGST